MEYERKFRWANYGSHKCKEYLRNDFSYECAYCKLQEKEIDIIGSAYFEIDHFKPQASDNPALELNLYQNLNYSCEKCNGEKNDFWSVDLLNPCESDIYKGGSHIVGGYDPNTSYKYEGVSLEGKLFIDTFKLNSRHQIRIRKRRRQRENYIKVENELINEILYKFSIKQELENISELIKQLDELREQKNNQVFDLLRDENFELVEQYLSSKGIKYSIVFEEYNMDFKIKCGEESIYCELIIDHSNQDNDMKNKVLKKEKLLAWNEKLSYKYGILYFYPKLNKLYLFPIPNLTSPEDVDKLRKKITLIDEFLL